MRTPKARASQRIKFIALAASALAAPALATPYGPTFADPPKQSAQAEPAHKAGLPSTDETPAIAQPISQLDPATPAESLPLPAPNERIPLGKPAESDPVSLSEQSPTSSLISLRSAASLALVLGLIVALKLVLTRAAKSSGSFASRLGAGGRAPSGILEVLGRYPVARGITLVLLRLDRRVLLLSQSAEGFATLAELTDPDEIASILTKSRDEEGESISSKFTSMLSRFERDHTIIEEPVEIPESPIATNRARLVRAGDITTDDIQTHLARIRELQG